MSIHYNYQLNYSDFHTIIKLQFLSARAKGVRMKKTIVILAVSLLSFSAFAQAKKLSKAKELSEPSVNGAYCVKRGQVSEFCSGYDKQAACLKSGGKLVQNYGN